MPQIKDIETGRIFNVCPGESSWYKGEKKYVFMQPPQTLPTETGIGAIILKKPERDGSAVNNTRQATNFKPPLQFGRREGMDG